MSFKSLAVCAAVLLSCAAPASAQAIRLRFHDGLVTLNTQNAPLRTILSEWARQGGATIVNGDRVNGPPLSLELNAVPERQALDVLLRSVSGYIAAPRPAGTPGAAAFDRIVILPTSSPPANVTPPPTAGRGFPVPRPGVGLPRPVMPQPPIVPDPDLLEEDPPQDIPPEEQEDPNVVTPQVRPRPGIRLPRGMVPGLLPPGQPFEIPEQEIEPEPEQPEPAVTTPGNPFGLPAGATSRPGVIAPVPSDPQQRTPRQDPEP